MTIRRLHRCALGAPGLVALIVLLEIITRVADFITYGAPIFQNYNEGSLFTRDALGRRGRPHARYLKWQLNSLGLRSPEVEEDRIHIICIGASETFGLYEAPDQEYPRQLEGLLNKAVGKDVYQVINVALPGVSLKSARIRIPEIVEAIQPKYAIIYTTWTPPQIPKPSAEATAESDSREPFEWRISARIREEARGYIPSDFQNWWREVKTRRQARSFAPILLNRVPEQDVELLKSNLVLMIDDLRSWGIQPVVVTHANRFGLKPVGEDRYVLTEIRRFFPRLSEEGFLDMERRMNEAVREVAAEEKVPLIDAAAQMPSGEAYFRDFSHFTTLGARVMAERLAEGLLPLLQTHAEGGSVTSPATVSKELTRSQAPPADR